jgi:hypothetical protein
MNLRGNCLRKAVCYEVDQLDMPIGHCHCVTCRKAHPAAFASTARVMRDQFRWTAGEEKPSTYESSPGKLRGFCSVCGTQLIAERPSQPHIILPVATLDYDPGVTPAMHIWTRMNHPGWLTGKEVPSISRMGTWSAVTPDGPPRLCRIHVPTVRWVTRLTARNRLQGERGSRPARRGRGRACR